MRVGVRVPNAGDERICAQLPAFAAGLEERGADSLWVSDHIVLPSRMDSHYPFSPDGRATFAPQTPFLDAVVAMSAVLAVTCRVEVGAAVLVALLRHPVELAKQFATMELIAPGRVLLGVGVGWLAEEFAALGVPFAGRGARFDEWLALVRDCWTGHPAAFDGTFYAVPDGVHCLPAAPRPPSVLIGGTSRAALRRAGRDADGWVAHEALPRLDVDALAAQIRELPASMRVVLRLVESAGRSDEVAMVAPALAAAGVDDLVVDLTLEDAGDLTAAERELTRIKGAAA